MVKRGSRHAAAMLDLVALTPDGLGVLRDGTLIRALQAPALAPLVMGAEDLEHTSRQLGTLLARIPAGQSLVFSVDSRALDAPELCARLAHRGERASRGYARGRGEALRRLGACVGHSILTHAGALAATSTTHLVVVPWTAPRPLLPLRRGDRAVRVQRVPVQAHQRAVVEHDRYVEQISSALAAMHLPARALDGIELAELVWARFAPARAATGETWAEHAPADALAPLDPGTAEQATARARALRASLCPEAISGHSVLRIGAAVEQTIAVSSVPEQTWVGWVMHLMQARLPYTLTVHVHATDRQRERTRQRRRYRRLYGVNRGTELRGRMVDPESVERESEAAELNAKLATSAGAGIYEISIYLSLRDPAGDEQRVRDEASAACKELVSVCDAFADTGRFAQRDLWRSTLPLGRDARRARRRYVTENAADTVPLVGSICGSPDSPTWIPLGYAQPGRTLEGIDPFDPAHPNHMLIVCGQAGGGKTMTTNLLLARCVAVGAQGAIVDRAGHYDFLCSLIPGAASIPVGAAGRTINPWDGEPTTEKIDFLLRLHELLVGAHDQRVDSHGLDVLQRAALAHAIRRVYARCQLTGESPREAILQEELRAMHQQAREEGAAEHASTLALLAESLHPYIGDGPYAYLADRPTTIPADASLLVFDTRQVSTSDAAAALFCICELMARRVEARRQRYLAGHDDRSPWAGRSFLVIDEAWKLLERRATGMWVNELARRSRHYALFLMAISQQLSDFKGAEGEALLSQSSMQLLLRQRPDQLPYLKQALGLCDEELDAIASLQTAKRQYASAYLINGSRGRGVLNLVVSDLEYWIATSDPANDQPLRHAALRDGGRDPWQALRLLADPAWHQHRRQEAR
jgi:hypothetical protein